MQYSTPDRQNAETSQRRHQRYDITLDVTLDVDGNQTSVRMKNLSLSGVLVRTPFSAGMYRPSTITEVRIPEVGALAVAAVWSSDFLIGLRFLNAARAKRLIAPFLTARGFDPK